MTNHAQALSLGIANRRRVTHGEGITIAIIDDFFDKRILRRDTQVEHWAIRRSAQRASVAHGTALAAIIAGIAPASRLVLIELPALCTAVEEAAAFNIAERAGADIVCCAWGPSADDPQRRSLSPLVADALKRLVQRGQGGLGSLVFFACEGNCESLDAYVGYPGAYAVRSIGESNMPPGSSGATALISGLAALVLSRRPRLPASRKFRALRCSLGPAARLGEETGSLPTAGLDTELRYRERRFNGGEHWTLGSLATTGIVRLWSESGQDPSVAFFGSRFRSFATQNTSPSFSDNASALIRGFVADVASVPAAFSPGGVEWGFLVAAAADLVGSPMDLRDELDRKDARLQDFVKIFENDIAHNFLADYDFDIATTSLSGTGRGDNVHFIDLARKNSSHFAGDSCLFYLAHHLVAITNAIWCGLATDPVIAKNRFYMALVSEAFAAHFLSDMFSAGHARVPRWAILNRVYNDSSSRADFLSRLLHQHEGRLGVFLTNDVGQVWYGFGDAGLKLGSTFVYNLNSNPPGPWPTEGDAVPFHQILTGDNTITDFLPRQVLPASLIFASLSDVFRHMAVDSDVSSSAIGPSSQPTGVLGYILRRIPYGVTSKQLSAAQLSLLSTTFGADKVANIDIRPRLQDWPELWKTYNSFRVVAGNLLGESFQRLDQFRVAWEWRFSQNKLAEWTREQTGHLRRDLRGIPGVSRLSDVPGLLACYDPDDPRSLTPTCVAFPSTTVKPYTLVSADLPQSWRDALPTSLCEALTEWNGSFWIVDP